CGLRAPVCAASGWRLLRHPRQGGYGCTSGVLDAHGSRSRCDLRSARHAQRLLLGQELPGASAAHRFKDPESGKTLVFLTNNTTLPALTIAALYKSRWQVELF